MRHTDTTIERVYFDGLVVGYRVWFVSLGRERGALSSQAEYYGMTATWQWHEQVAKQEIFTRVARHLSKKKIGWMVTGTEVCGNRLCK